MAFIYGCIGFAAIVATYWCFVRVGARFGVSGTILLGLLWLVARFL